MPLPDRIPVKSSSDAGESSLTRVFVEPIELTELVERMLGFTGKDAALLQEVLARGSFVSGATRLRWEGLSISIAEAEQLLARFPGSDPHKVFDASKCTGAQLLEGRVPIEIPKEAAAARRLLRRRSFWDVLMELAAAKPLAYVDYSYKLRADRYCRELAVSETALLKEQASLLTHAGLAQYILENDFRTMELFTHR